jgi:hypothetical protein
MPKAVSPSCITARPLTWPLRDPCVSISSVPRRHFLVQMRRRTRLARSMRVSMADCTSALMATLRPADPAQ